MMLKLKLQYFGHVIQRTSSLEKTLMLGKIECIEEVDISGTSVKYLNGKIGPVMHIDLRGLLIRVTAIFKFKFFHFKYLTHS